MFSQADQAPSLLFAPDLGEVNDEIELSREEAHYVTRVCRLRAGDRLQATNGRGVIATIEIVALGSVARARVETRETHTRNDARAVWCGAPEGQRADWLVEKLAELGIACWQPIDCERVTWSAAARRLERWERLTIAALRQSRRPFRMEIRAPIDLGRALAERPADSTGWWADRAGAPCLPKRLGAAPLIGVIGPAQGLGPAEKNQLWEAGFSAISLSDSRLRTETAAMAWAVWSGLGGSGDPSSTR